MKIKAQIIIHIQYQSNKGNSNNNNSNSISNTTSTNKMINIDVLNCKIILILTIISETKSPNIILNIEFNIRLSSSDKTSLKASF